MLALSLVVQCKMKCNGDHSIALVGGKDFFPTYHLARTSTMLLKCQLLQLRLTDERLHLCVPVGNNLCAEAL